MDETLIQKVSESLGLPQEKVEKSLKQWILQSGRSPQDMTLEDLREVLVWLVQDVFTEVANDQNPFIRLQRSVSQQ